MARKRTDAERRARQTDRLARVLRLLQLIHGPGGWNAPSLAEKLGCSERTVFRDLQTLKAAGVPWVFDEYSQSYRIREGYRGHLLDVLPPGEITTNSAPQASPGTDDPRSIAMLAREAAQRLLAEAEGVILALDRLTKAMEDMSGPRPK